MSARRMLVMWRVDFLCFFLGGGKLTFYRIEYDNWPYETIKFKKNRKNQGVFHLCKTYVFQHIACIIRIKYLILENISPEIFSCKIWW